MKRLITKEPITLRAPNKDLSQKSSNRVLRITRWVVLVILLPPMFIGVTICPGQRRSRGVPLRIVQLPEPKFTSSVSFEDALVKQRIVSQFTGQPLKPEQISQLAWAGQGTAKRPLQPGTLPQSSFPSARTRQSPEQLRPINLYFVMPDGIYIYSPNEHSLRQTSNQDLRRNLATACSTGFQPLHGQDGRATAVATAGCDIIITGSTRGSTGRSSITARRIMLLYAGQIAQNIQLQSVTLELAFMPVSDFDTRSVSNICNITRTLEPLYMICIGYPVIQTPVTTGQTQGTLEQEKKRAEPKTAVLIISRENFQDRELFDTLRTLTSANVQTAIAGSITGVVKGMHGGVAEARIPLNQIRVDDYDAIIFIGGTGAMEYFNNPAALDIARNAAAKGKVLAAISIAPTILANAGVLRGVRATSFPSEQAVLQQAGAIYTNNPVERDKQIITATGPIAVTQFAGAIVEALDGK